MDKKTSHFPLDLKMIEENGAFSGYASVFNIEDNHNDIIISGAFSNSLQKNGRWKDIKLLWQHRSDEPIGIFTKMVEDEHGLYVEGKLLLDVQRAKEAYTLLRSGIIKGLSIGFIVKKYDHDESGARVIFEAELWEISLVTFPANEAAQISVVKSMDGAGYPAFLSTIDKAIRILTI